MGEALIAESRLLCILRVGFLAGDYFCCAKIRLKKARTCLFCNCKQSVRASSMTSNLLNSLELSQQWNKTLMFSSRQINWNGVLVEQCQSPASAFEMELPALSDHWLYFHTGDPAPLVQKRGDRLHESILHSGLDESYWYCLHSLPPLVSL
jgi:AraC family transcriptional regulator